MCYTRVRYILGLEWGLCVRIDHHVYSRTVVLVRYYFNNPTKRDGILQCGHNHHQLVLAMICLNKSLRGGTLLLRTLWIKLTIIFRTKGCLPHLFCTLYLKLGWKWFCVRWYILFLRLSSRINTMWRSIYNYVITTEFPSFSIT